MTNIINNDINNNGINNNGINNNDIKLSLKQFKKFRTNLSKRIQNINTISKKKYSKKYTQKYTQKNKKQNTYINEYEIKVYEDHNKYINAIDIIYWINLDRSVDRKKRMEKILKNFNIKNKRIKASDGKLESYEDIYGNFICNNFVNTKLEYACLLSHLNTIKEFANSNNQISLILEDDISLDFSIYWDKYISKIIDDAPKDWNIIMIGYTYNKQLINLYTDNTDNINDKKIDQIWSTLSYIINKKGAHKLINKILENNKYNISSLKNHVADFFLYKTLKTYTYKYPYFTYNNNIISTIQIIDNSVYPIIKTFEIWKYYILEKVKNKGKNIYLLNNNYKNIINEKYIFENSYGVYCNYYYKNNYLTKNYIIFKKNTQNVYIYFEKQYINKKIFFIENILSKNNLIKKIIKNKELKFILDYINNK